MLCVSNVSEWKKWLKWELKIIEYTIQENQMTWADVTEYKGLQQIVFPSPDVSEWFSHTLGEDVVNFFAHSLKDNVILTSSHWSWHVCIRGHSHTHAHLLTQYSSVIANVVTSKRSIKKRRRNYTFTSRFLFKSFKIMSNFMQGDALLPPVPLLTVCSKWEQQSNH